MELNISALYMVGALVTIIGAVAALLTWSLHRYAPGLRAWAVALLLSSVGALVQRIYGQPPDIRLALAANAIIVSGFAMMWMSLRLYNQGLANRVRLLITAIIASGFFAALSILAAAAGAGQLAAAIPFSVFLGVLSLAAGYEVWSGQRQDGLRSRLVTALAFAGLGLARLIRATTLGLEVAGALAPGMAGVFHAFTLYATIVFFLIITYGLVMMANERALRDDEALFR